MNSDVKNVNSLKAQVIDSIFFFRKKILKIKISKLFSYYRTLNRLHYCVKITFEFFFICTRTPKIHVAHFITILALLK